MKTFNVVCALIIIGFLLVLSVGDKFRNDKNTNSTEKQFKFVGGREFYLLLIYSVIIIRCIGLGSIPGGFNQDGAMGAVDALSLATYGTDRFGTHLPAHFQAWGYGQMSVLLSYLTVPFIKLWGLTELTARLPMMIASMMGAVAIYGIVKELISEKAALIMILFTVINPWHFMQSRWALDCNMFPHMFIIGTYFLVLGLSKRRYYYISMIFYALCMYSYGVAFYMVPVFLLVSCIILLVAKKIDWKQTALCVLTYFGISFPIYGTMLINYMKWETVELPFVTMQYFQNSVRMNDMLFFSEEPINQFVINCKALCNVVFLQKHDLIWNAIDDFGTMYQCTLPLIVIGLGITGYLSVKASNEKSRLIYQILLIYWVCSMFTGICINSVNVNRINIIFYSHILFAGIAIYYCVRKWKIFAAIILVIYALQSFLFVNCYFTEWAEQMEEVFYDDFLEAVEFAGNQNGDCYFITPDSQYVGSWHVSEILTQFALQMDAEYLQGKTNVFNGVENPYKNRFRYKNPEGVEISADYRTVYVIKNDKLIYYDQSLFAIKYFDDYCVVMPKQYANW